MSIPQNPHAADRPKDPPSIPPHPARTQAVRVFYADRLVDTDPGVAVLNISISAGGLIHSHALGLDTVHARLVLEEIDRIRPALVDHINRHSNVIPIR